MKLKDYIRKAAVGTAVYLTGIAISMGLGATYYYLSMPDKKPELEKIVISGDYAANEKPKEGMNPVHNYNENQVNYNSKTALENNLEKRLDDNIKPKKKLKQLQKVKNSYRGDEDIDIIKITVNHQEDSKPVDISYNIDADHAVVVSKREQMAYLFNLDNMSLEKKYTVSTAKKSGPKRVIGDNKTPEGFFKVTGVKKKEGAIGPYAVYYDYVFSEDRINNGVLGTPMHGIKSYRLGQPASHGCTRFSRSDITDLIKYINKNDLVIIYDGPKNPKEMLIRQLKRMK